MRSTALVTLLACVLAIAGCGDGGGGDHGTAGAGHGATRQSDVPAAKRIELVFPYGSEKKMWVNAVTEQFNREQRKTAGGKVIHVKAIAMGSGETVAEIMEGRLEAHLMSPASAAFIRLGNAESQAKFGNDLVDRTTELVLSPVVIAMWKPMAEAIGWGERPVGWSDILELVRNDEGWGAYGYPQWGRFKFGHTHPEYSNSGLISLFAEVYAATGKKGGLTIADVEAPETGAFLREIEQSVVHYGSSTGFFGRRLFGSGPRT
jgi:Ca-activated chloride channel family protein